MKIHGIENMTDAELQQEVERGGKFVLYSYCISALVITFRRSSDIYFIRAGESAIVKGLGYTALSFFLGWWGIPWGPIFTVGSFITNFRGGKDVTPHVINLPRPAPPAAGSAPAASLPLQPTIPKP